MGQLFDFLEINPLTQAGAADHAAGPGGDIAQPRGSTHQGTHSFTRKIFLPL